jgi:hypothetical protein
MAFDRAVYFSTRRAPQVIEMNQVYRDLVRPDGSRPW